MGVVTTLRTWVAQQTTGSEIVYPSMLKIGHVAYQFTWIDKRSEGTVVHSNTLTHNHGSLISI